MVDTFEMGFEVIRPRPNLVLISADTNSTDVAISRCLAIRVYAPFVSVKVIWRAEALNPSGTVVKIAFKWFLMASIVLPGGPDVSSDALWEKHRLGSKRDKL